MIKWSEQLREELEAALGGGADSDEMRVLATAPGAFVVFFKLDHATEEMDARKWFCRFLYRVDTAPADPMWFSASHYCEIGEKYKALFACIGTETADFGDYEEVPVRPAGPRSSGRKIEIANRPTERMLRLMRRHGKEFS